MASEKDIIYLAYSELKCDIFAGEATVIFSDCDKRNLGS